MFRVRSWLRVELNYSKINFFGQQGIPMKYEHLSRIVNSYIWKWVLPLQNIRRINAEYQSHVGRKLANNIVLPSVKTDSISSHDTKDGVKWPAILTLNTCDTTLFYLFFVLSLLHASSANLGKSLEAVNCYQYFYVWQQQWWSQPVIWSCKCKFFCIYRPYKESISKEMNNDNDLNLHLHDQMSGWLRYWTAGHGQLFFFLL